MRYPMVLWDFDGTLADTMGCLLRIYNELAARNGYRPVEDPKSVRGLTLLTFLHRHGIPLTKLPALVRDVLAAQKGMMTGIRLFPGLDLVLREVRRAGCRMAVLSSNAGENIRACLQANGVLDLFEEVAGYRRLFGKGRALRRFLRAQGLAGRDVVYVGDEVRDIEAAREAGVAVAAVTWGYQAGDLLAQHLPDHLLASPEQVLHLLG
jgi:phosphoglycolate phosphatase-like HAD superfamily hydrolase